MSWNNGIMLGSSGKMIRQKRKNLDSTDIIYRSSSGKMNSATGKMSWNNGIVLSFSGKMIRVKSKILDSTDMLYRSTSGKMKIQEEK